MDRLDEAKRRFSQFSLPLSVKVEILVERRTGELALV